MRARLRSPLLVAAAASCLVFLAIYGLRVSGALQGLELAVYDWHVRLRPAAHRPAPPVTLVQITDADIQQVGTWPLPDAVLAEVLEAVSRAGAVAIGLDIYRDIPVSPGHERFSAVLREHSQIIGSMMLPQAGRPGVAPPPALKGSDRVGFTDVVVDPGGTVRRGLLLMDDGQNIFYSLPLRLALLYLEAHGVPVQGDPDHAAHIRLGRTTIVPFEPNDGAYVRADAGGYQFLLDYGDPPETFASITLDELRARRFDPGLFKDKIVLVGVAADSVKDSFDTPLNRGAGKPQGTYGVALVGQVTNQLVRAGIAGDAPTAVTSDLNEALWILLWTLLGGAAAYALRTASRLVLATLAGLALLAIAVQGMFVVGLWLPLLPPALGWVLAAGLVTGSLLTVEKTERAQLMALFSSHVSAPLAEAIWQERELFMNGGRPRPQRLTATVLFSDIVGFTSVSEKLEPQSLMDWFYGFMEVTTPLASEHGGLILQLVGDAIMAVFGVPVARTSEKDIARDAVNAVSCALAIQERLIALNRSLEQRRLPLIGVRIGILTGPMVAGSLGSARRREYNVHGDTVNTAARLESFDRDSFAPDYFAAPCRILLGESTLRLLGDVFQTEFLGEFQLKGKTHVLRIYRVYGRNEAGSRSDGE